MDRHERLIENLSRDLSPVAPARNVNLVGLAWLLASAIFVVAVTQWTDPVRPGVFGQLQEAPRFLLETVLGVAAITWVGLLAFRSAVPGELTRRFAVAGLALMALWLAQYVIGLVSPALEPSEWGKRPFCYLETMIYSAPPILAAWTLGIPRAVHEANVTPGLANKLCARVADLVFLAAMAECWWFVRHLESSGAAG